MSISHHASRHYLWTLGLEFLKGATLLASTWILKEEGRGLMALAYIIPNVVLIFGSLGLETAAPYFLGKRIAPETQIAGSMVWGAFLLGLGWMLATSVVMAIPGVIEAEVSWQMRLLVLATMPFALMRQTLTALLIYRRWVVRSVLLNGVQRLGNLLAMLALGLLIMPGVAPTGLVETLLIFQFGILIGSVALGLWIQRDWVLHRPRWTLFRSMLGFGALQAVSVSAMYLLHSGDQYLLGKLGGASAVALVGIYSAAFGLLSMVTALSRSIAQVFFRVGVEHEGEDRTRIALDVGRRTVLLVTMVAAGMAVAVWPLMLVLPEGFAEVPYVLSILLLSAPLYALGQMPDAAMIAQGHVGRAVIAPLVAVALNVLLNILWIPRFGMFGAAWATVAGFLLLGILRLWLFARTAPGFAWSRALVFRASDLIFVVTKSREALVGLLRKSQPSA